MFGRRKKEKLVYIISETHFFSKDYSIAVVNFVGEMTKETISILQICEEQISKLNSKWLILNFRDVSSTIDTRALEGLHQFHISIREKPGTLKLAGLHPTLKTIFLEKKLIDEQDIFNNLAEAIHTLSQISIKKDAA